MFALNNACVCISTVDFPGQHFHKSSRLSQGARGKVIIANVQIGVVDHERLTRDFIVNVMMYSVNREILVFESAEDLKAYLSQGKSMHLLLAEMNLPETTGFELLRFIKKQFPDICFVAMSA